MALAALIVRIGADLTDLNKGLTQADKDVQKVGKRLVKFGSTLTQNLTVPIVAAAAGLGAASVHVARFADELLDLVDMTGLSSDTLQEFRHVAAVAGVESDTLANAAIKLTTAMKSGGEQSKQLSGALKALGLSATNANGGLVSMDKLMPAIISRLQGVTDVTTRNAIAADIFGKSWAELAPILGLGAGAMAKAQEEARKLGLVLSKGEVEKADAYRQKLDLLKESAGALASRLGIMVIPVMTKLVDFMQGSLIPALNNAIKWFDQLSPGVKVTIGVVAGLAAAMGPLIVAIGSVMTIWPALVAMFTAATGPAAAIAVSIGVIAVAGYQLVENWDSVKLQFILAWTAMKDAVFTLVEKMLGAMVKMFGWVPGLGEKIRALKAEFDAFAQGSLLDSMTKIDAYEAKILKSADATSTFTSKVVQLSNALKGLPKNITLPGIARAMNVGVGADFGPIKPLGPFVFTDEMRDGLRKNMPTPGTPAAAGPNRLVGALQAGLGGSQIGQIAQAAAAFGPFAALLPVVNGALEVLEPVITKLIEPLVEIGRVVGDLIAPVLEMLAPSIKLVTDYLMRGLVPVIQVVVTAFSYFMEAIGWVVRGIGKLVDSLPFVSAKGVIEAGQSLMDAAQAARDNARANDGATRALDKFASSLTNLPRVLNVNALRHMVTGAPAGGSTAGGRGPAPYGNIYITVPGSGDPEATARAVARTIERTRARGGISPLTVAITT